MAGKPLAEVVEAGWAQALAPVAQRVADMGDFLRAEIAAGRRYLPAGPNVLRAFTQPLRRGAGADRRARTRTRRRGTRWGCRSRCRRPRGRCRGRWRTSSASTPPTSATRRPSTGDLTPWAEQGVLLLNRVLTVAPGEPGSHRDKGWEAVTEQAIRALVARDGEPLVAILWGRDARNLAPLLGDVPLIESAHPSPMSADRGFFGSRPFSRANALLEELGGEPVDWKLP